MQNLAVFIAALCLIATGLWMLHPAAALIASGVILLAVWWLATQSAPAEPTETKPKRN